MGDQILHHYFINNSNDDDDDDDDESFKSIKTNSITAAHTNAISYRRRLASSLLAIPLTPSISINNSPEVSKSTTSLSTTSQSTIPPRFIQSPITSTSNTSSVSFNNCPSRQTGENSFNLAEKLLETPKRDKLRSSKSLDFNHAEFLRQQQQKHAQVQQQQQEQLEKQSKNQLQQNIDIQKLKNTNEDHQKHKHHQPPPYKELQINTAIDHCNFNIHTKNVTNNFNDCNYFNNNFSNGSTINNNKSNTRGKTFKNSECKKSDEEKTKEQTEATSSPADVEKETKDIESFLSGEMPINYCYVKPGHVSTRRSNRLSSAIMTTSSSFSSAEDSLAAIFDPIRFRSCRRGDDVWRRRRSEVGSGNVRVERAVRVSFVITLLGLMAGTIITVFGFVRVDGWSEQKQLALQILGPTCLVSMLAVWTVGALFWYLWRSEWSREKQAMELKSRVHLHAIAMDLLKRSSSNLDSPLSSIVGSNLLLQASGIDRRMRRKLLAKFRQQETVEYSSNDNSRRSSRALSIDSRLQRHSSCSGVNNATNVGSDGSGKRRSPYSSKGGSSGSKTKRRILIPAGFDVPGIKISRFETIDLEDQDENKTLELLIEGARKKKKDSAVSTGSANSAINSKSSRKHRHHHYCGSSSSFSRRYIVVRSSDASSDYSRLSEYSLTGSRNGSHSRSSRSSRDSSVLSGSQRLFYDFTSPYASRWDVENDDVAASEVVVASYEALMKGVKGHEPSHKKSDTGGRNYTLLTPSIPRKNSIVTFDISEPSVRRHSSPVPSLKRKDSSTVVAPIVLDGPENGEDENKQQSPEHHHHHSHIHRIPSSCFSKRHLLPVSSLGKMAPRRRSCEKSLPLISITRESNSPTLDVSGGFVEETTGEKVSEDEKNREY